MISRKIPEYSVWSEMRRRCSDEKAWNYKYYGGRGISVCSKWLDSFDAFMEDMGRRPSSEHSLERLENDVGYEPGNCAWVTQKEQARNRGNNVYVEYGGERRLLVEVCESIGVRFGPVYQRVFVHDWSLGDALSIPVRAKVKNGLGKRNK